MKASENFQKFFNEDSPLIIAHRGFSAIAPENTISSFKLAIKAKADMIELDVRTTRDGTVVVIHDAYVDRTTNGIGKVKKFYLWNLKELDAGSWFNPKFKGEKIPTLDEVLTLTGGKIPINIEIKKSGKKEQTVEKVLAVVYERKLEDKVLISSFDPRIVRKVRKLTDEVPTALLYHYPVYFNPAKMLRRLGANALILNYKFARQNIVKKLHDSNYKIFVYTVNEISDIKKMLEMEIDGIITDDVRTTRKAVEKFLKLRTI